MPSLDNWLQNGNNDTHATNGALRAALIGEGYDLSKDLGVIAASLEDDRAGLRAALMGYNNVTRGKVDGLFAAAKQRVSISVKRGILLFEIVWIILGVWSNAGSESPKPREEAETYVTYIYNWWTVGAIFVLSDSFLSYDNYHSFGQIVRFVGGIVHKYCCGECNCRGRCVNYDLSIIIYVGSPLLLVLILHYVFSGAY